MLAIGAHVDQTDPLAEAAARGADLVQFFRGDPQGWPAPYVINVAGHHRPIDLVHANGSRDPNGSGRDRPENFGAGQIDPTVIVAVVEAAGAPVVCETPGGVEGQARDIAFLRDRLPV